MKACARDTACIGVGVVGSSSPEGHTISCLQRLSSTKMAMQCYCRPCSGSTHTADLKVCHGQLSTQ